MPIAIVGTGRSGTSMVSRMLNLCGVYLGEQSDLTAQDEWNPKGFWEHNGFYNFNERLLAVVGGKYGFPPRLGENWEYDGILDDLLEEARTYIEETFCGHGEWAWKSPAATVTLPFWRRVIPDLKVVVCLRNPVDYAASINKYYSLSQEHALANWQYNTFYVLSLLSPEERILTFYEDYFPNYHHALDPLLARLGLEVPQPGSAADEAIRSFHDPSLKHHTTSLAALVSDNTVPYMVKELYLELLADNSQGIDLPILGNAEQLLPLMRQAITPDLVDRELEANLKRQLQTLQNQNRQMEQILGSRTHRIAAFFCDLLIRLRSTNLRLSKKSEPAAAPGLVPSGDAQPVFAFKGGPQAEESRANHPELPRSEQAERNSSASSLLYR